MWSENTNVDYNIRSQNRTRRKFDSTIQRSNIHALIRLERLATPRCSTPAFSGGRSAVLFDRKQQMTRPRSMLSGPVRLRIAPASRASSDANAKPSMLALRLPASKRKPNVPCAPTSSWYLHLWSHILSYLLLHALSKSDQNPSESVTEKLHAIRVMVLHRFHLPVRRVETSTYCREC